jgi:hypothetical protein
MECLAVSDVAAADLHVFAAAFAAAASPTSDAPSP